MKHRVRRLLYGPPIHRTARPLDIFAALRKHESWRPIEVGLHAKGLDHADPTVDLIVGELAPHARRNAPVVWASPGMPGRAGRPAFVTFDVQDLPSGLSSAVAQAPAGETRALVSGHERWRWIAEHQLHDRGRVPDLLELEGLAALGSDVILTNDSALLAIREHPHLRGLNLMTPQEGFVLVGVLSRLTHSAFVSGLGGTNTGLYYWALARALTPAAWPAFAAYVELERHGPRDRLHFDLAGSILDRLTSTGRALDRLVSAWQCKTDNDTLAELIDEFDRVVLNTWGIYDNIALLAGHSFDISLQSPSHWNVLNAAWLNRVIENGGPKGRAIAGLVDAERAELKASHEVRHQMAHRARLRRLRLVGKGRGPDEPRVWLTGENVLSRLDAAAELQGTSLADWGIEERYPAGRESVGLVGAGEAVDTYEIEVPQRALVDPLAFALRVAAHGARLANEAFRILDPAADPRIAHEPRLRSLPGPPEQFDWSSPRAASTAVLLSPLSGLADWAVRL